MNVQLMYESLRITPNINTNPLCRRERAWIYLTVAILAIIAAVGVFVYPYMFSQEDKNGDVEGTAEPYENDGPPIKYDFK